MKKIAILIVMALLCQNFYTTAQENKAVDVISTGLQIGQKVPDITITNLHNYKDSSGQLVTTANLSDFKGKLLILDFWATWCAPCIGMIPRMEALQKQYEGKIQFLSLTYETEQVVLPFLSKLQKQENKVFTLPVLTDSKVLHTLFPHKVLPHYVWIDGTGVVRAITGLHEVNEQGIQKMLKGFEGLTVKQDLTIKYDSSKPLFMNGNGGNGENIKYRSLLSGYVEGLGGGYSFSHLDTTKQSKISVRNSSLMSLYALAFGNGKELFGRNKISLLVNDTSKFATNAVGIKFLSWLRSGNGYCYDLILSKELAINRFKIMRQDLERLFPNYRCTVQSQIKKCLVLVRTSTVDKIKSSGGESRFSANSMGFKMQNYGFGRLIAEINIFSMRKSAYPIVNGTAYMGRVDMEVNAKMASLSELNASLAKYDLSLVLQDRPINVLVIEDNIK